MSNLAYDKHRSRRNKKIVRELFNQEWDPIGGCPEDEYDTYGAKVYVMLMHEGASVGQITDYLWWVETEYMGLSSDEDRYEQCAKVAQKLVEMKPMFEAANDL